MASRNPVTREIKNFTFLSSDSHDVLSQEGDPVAYDLRDKGKKRRGCPFMSPNTNIQEASIPSPEETVQLEILTDNVGKIIDNDEDELKIGPRGPVLLGDVYLRRKLMHFDHERIPERVVHARGSGAFGEFTCTRDMSSVTSAAFLSEVGKKTKIAVRFSQTVGSKGSPDTVRDVRGMAIKFYTEDGNYDLVGNDIPVFFIQSAIKFPDLVHAIKPEPNSNMPQATGAHDNFWDFISRTPESAHMILWLMSDIGLIRSYRTMDAFGVNTFKFINIEGRVHLVKLHILSQQGVETMSWDTAQEIAGKDIDYMRRDLWEALERGIYPKYNLGVQLMPLEEENSFSFDPLDPTKVWPENLFPVHIMGELVLNQNPSNFFTEVEQLAFCPANVVPGIDFSDDPLLQGRLFSYDDTQLNRFTSVNWEELPVNKPLAPVRNNFRDGFMRRRINRGTINYQPNREGNMPIPLEKVEGAFIPPEGNTQVITGEKVRTRGEKFKDHISQAREKWQVMSPEQKEHTVGAFHYELGHVKDVEIRKKIIRMFSQVSSDLGLAIASGLVL